MEILSFGLSVDSGTDFGGSRLKKLYRPLRLCYFGEVVRSEGTILRPERQFLQIGAEIIGEKNYLADVEILSLAFESLQIVGIKNIFVEFSNQIFLDQIINSGLAPNKKKDFLMYLKRKDKLKSLSILEDNKKKKLLENLFNSRGNLKSKIKMLDVLRINNRCSEEIDNLLEIHKSINKKYKNINFNIDFTEYKIDSYYSGTNFTVFAKNVRGEIASGGRYLTNNRNGEFATGFTCYMDTILRASSYTLKQNRILVPFDTNKTQIQKLINKNFIIERSLNSVEKLSVVAKTKNCTHFFSNGKIKKI